MGSSDGKTKTEDDDKEGGRASPLPANSQSLPKVLNSGGLTYQD